MQEMQQTGYTTLNQGIENPSQNLSVSEQQTTTKTSSVAEKTILGLGFGSATGGYAILGYAISVLVFGSNPVGWIAAAVIATSFVLGFLLGYNSGGSTSNSDSIEMSSMSSMTEAPSDSINIADSIITNDPLDEFERTPSTSEKSKKEKVVDFPYVALPSDETREEIDTLRNQIFIESGGMPSVHEACDYSVNFLQPLYENMVLFLNNLNNQSDRKRAISDKIASVTQQMAELETSNDPDKKHKMINLKMVLSELTTLATEYGEANWNQTLETSLTRFKQSLEQAKQAPSQRDAELEHSQRNIRKWKDRIQKLESQPAKPSSDIPDSIEVVTPLSSTSTTPNSSTHSTTEHDLDTMRSAPVVASSTSQSSVSEEQSEENRIKKLFGKMKIEGSVEYSPKPFTSPKISNDDGGEYTLSAEEEERKREQAKISIGSISTQQSDFYSDMD